MRHAHSMALRPRGLGKPPAIVPSTNLVGHYVASDLSTGAVATWTARVGTNLTQADAGRRPVRVASSVGNTAAVQSDGVDDFLAGSFTFSGAFTVVLVIRPVTIGNSTKDGLFDGFVNSSALIYHRTTPTLGLFPNNSGVTWSGNLATTRFQTLVCAFTTTAGAGYIRSDRTTRSTGHMTGVSPGGITIGARGTGVQQTNTEYAEILLYSGVLSGAALTAVEDYCTAVYGVT